MYDDDDLFSFFNSYNSGSTTTETEQETNTSVGYNPSSYNGYSSNTDTSFVDDYTTRQNYQDERSYQPTTTSSTVEVSAPKTFREMEKPTILKEEKAVTLTKTRQKINLNARMKIMITMFSVIMTALVFVIAWNFISAAKINANSTQKLQTIESLQASISSLASEYNDSVLEVEAELTSNPGEFGFEMSNSSNTHVVPVDKMPTEPVIEELPSNWFNDVCEFFSKLFA